MFQRLFVLATLFAFLALPVLADDSGDWDQGGSKIASGGKSYTEFTSAVSPANIEFSITTSYALACFKPDITANGTAASAIATIHYCTPGVATPSAAACIKLEVVGGATLDGTEGNTATQRTCLPLGTGTYFVAFTAPSSGTSRFSVEAQ